MVITHEGRWALVCGASQGIGAAIAQELANSGARVILLARDQAAIEAVKITLKDSHQHITMNFDLENSDKLADGVHGIMKTTGPISILINNSGGPKSGPLLDADPLVFDKAFRTHVLASHILAKQLIPGMKEKRFGRIINIISTSVKTPLPNLGVSNTIRAAMASWAKSLANEVASYGITVNNVLPGYTQTPRLKSLIEAAAQRSGVNTNDIEEQWRESVPMKRFAQPIELAQAVSFLASNAANYISGINLPVDGGRTPSL